MLSVFPKRQTNRAGAAVGIQMLDCCVLFDNMQTLSVSVPEVF